MIGKMIQPYLWYGAAAVWLATATWGGVQWLETVALTAKIDKIEKDAATAAVEFERAARKQTEDHAAAMDAVAKAHEKEKADAIQVERDVAAGLRAGNLRLREHWRVCGAGVPEADAGAGERNAIAELRRESAARIIRIGAEADAALRACQAVIRADRE